MSCPNEHARQHAVVDPETGDVAWVCVDCGALMNPDRPDELAPVAVVAVEEAGAWRCECGAPFENRWQLQRHRRDEHAR